MGSRMLFAHHAQGCMTGADTLFHSARKNAIHQPSHALAQTRTHGRMHMRICRCTDVTWTQADDTSTTSKVSIFMQKCVNVCKCAQIHANVHKHIQTHTYQHKTHIHIHMITCDTLQHAQTAPRRLTKLIIACTHTSPRRPRTPYAMYTTHAYARKRTSRLSHAT